MIARVDRREFIASAAAATGALALPARLAAQPSGSMPRATRILEIARREVARAGDVLWRRDIAGIADFGLHSAVPRFHFANLEDGTVSSYLVAHGIGSDPEHDGWLTGSRTSSVRTPPAAARTSPGNGTPASTAPRSGSAASIPTTRTRSTARS